MGDTPDPPPVPKAADVAAQQQTYNTTAGANSQVGSAVSQNTPYGKLEYSTTIGPDGIPHLTSNTTLSPQQQQLLNQLQKTQKTAGQAGGQLLAGANYGTAPDLTTSTDSIVNQNLAHQVNYLKPFFDQQSEGLDNQLRNQGLSPGTQAYDRALNTLRQNQNQSVEGYLATNQNQAHQQAIQNYQLPLQTSSALAQLGAPGDVTRSLINTPQANYQPVNYIGASGQEQNALNTQYQQQLKSNSDLMSGIFGTIGTIGGAALGGPLGAKLGGSLGSGLGGA